MRLIDVDKMNLLLGVSDRDIYAKRMLDHMDTVDAVPIVRCKDCKYYNRGELLAPNKFCFRLKHPTENRVIGYNFAPDDFCSYGERKNADENGSR